eukprot:SAG11_NODE_11057_length_786_cov_1.410480_1_plen_110_part_01
MTLLGDAAHAMRPNGSNGATQSILDAVALAEALPAAAAAAAVPTALEAYEAERLEPANRVGRPALSPLPPASRRQSLSLVMLFCWRVVAWTRGHAAPLRVAGGAGEPRHW